MAGSCEGCPSSAATLKLAIEEAVRRAAPDVLEIEAEGAGAPDPLQIEVRTPAWATAGGMAELPDGRPLVRDVAGRPVLFTRVDGSVYAYEPACPACGASLGEAAASGAELTCAACGHAYDVVFAGRCRDAPDLHLDPLPLLVDDAGRMRVALGSAA
jgi:nitrite reductase/ring-hydroxylating ferredoxin subunit